VSGLSQQWPIDRPTEYADKGNLAKGNRNRYRQYPLSRNWLSLISRAGSLLALGISLFGEISSLFDSIGKLVLNALICRRFCWSKSVSLGRRREISLSIPAYQGNWQQRLVRCRLRRPPPFPSCFIPLWQLSGMCRHSGGLRAQSPKLSGGETAFAEVIGAKFADSLCWPF
jgi:hypothetical protein